MHTWETKSYLSNYIACSNIKMLLVLQQLENQLLLKSQQVEELESQADHLRRIEPENVNNIEQRRALVADR